MPGPDTVEEIGALAILEEAVALLYSIIMWGVALAIGLIWEYTFGVVFNAIANALSFTVNTHVGYKHTFHLGGWASSLNHKALELFSGYAKDQELAVGRWWYAIGWTVNQMVVTAEETASAGARFAHWVVHTAIPGTIDATLKPWIGKTNKAAAAAGLAGIAAATLKKITQAEHRAETAADKATAAAARAAGHEAHQAHAVATTVANTVTHETKVITQVVDVGALPVPFGRTIAQIKKRIGLLEAATGATAVALAMANVLGIPSWRCLTKGPIGRTARALCGIPSHLLNDLLGLIADFFILENVCVMLPWLEAAASDIGTPLVAALTDVGAGLCHGSQAPAVLQGPSPSVPALVFGVSASGV